MSEYATAVGGHAAHDVSPISVLWVLAASLLLAGGQFMIFWWLYTFNLRYFEGPFLVLAAVFMFLHPRAGWDHS